MGNAAIHQQNTFSRLGFHYYDDTDHYDEASLDYWLPKLKIAKTKWIVLYISEKVEIPEKFLTRLSTEGIEPIINLQLSISAPPDDEVFRQRMAYYHNAGVHMIQFFARPNMKNSWDALDWQKPDLVARFMTRFHHLALICISCQMIPIFPALTPGGDYLDLAFFGEALEKLAEQKVIIPNMVFAVDAGFHEHPLRWGKQNAETESENTDHRGFYCFEWYQAMIRKKLQSEAPMILLHAAQWSAQTGPFDTTPKESKQQFFEALALVQENFSGNQLPDYVISCNFYKLPTEYVLAHGNELSFAPGRFSKLKARFAAIRPSSPTSHRQAKTVGAELGGLLIRLLQVFLPVLLAELKPILSQIGENLMNLFRSLVAVIFRGEKITDYFLIPDVLDLLTEDQKDMINQFLKTTRCKSGRNLNAALASKNVILINDKTLYPQDILKLLHSNNCQIRTVSVSKKGK